MKTKLIPILDLSLSSGHGLHYLIRPKQITCTSKFSNCAMSTQSCKSNASQNPSKPNHSSAPLAKQTHYPQKASASSPDQKPKVTIGPKRTAITSLPSEHGEGIDTVGMGLDACHVLVEFCRSFFGRDGDVEAGTA